MRGRPARFVEFHPGPTARGKTQTPRKGRLCFVCAGSVHSKQEPNWPPAQLAGPISVKGYISQKDTGRLAGTKEGRRCPVRSSIRTKLALGLAACMAFIAEGGMFFCVRCCRARGEG